MKKYMLSIIFTLLLIPSIAFTQPHGSPFGPVPPDDTEYDSVAWNGSYLAPTQNAIRDWIEGAGGGGIGGTDTQVQYNDGGAFGGDAGFTYDDATDALTVVGPISGATIDTGQGANELYAMNQDVESTDSPTFVTVDPTGVSDGNLPYIQPGAAGFGDSPLDRVDATTVSITGTDPAFTLIPATAVDTRFWFGNINDADGVDDDKFQIGKGIVPGTTPFFTLLGNGNVGIGTDSPKGYIQISDKYVVVSTFTSAGINAAIDALGAESGEVYLPEGDYDVTASIVIDYDNTTLRGAGKGTRLLATNRFVYDTVTGTPAAGETLTGDTTGYTATVVQVDLTNKIVWYHSISNAANFNSGEVISWSGAADTTLVGAPTEQSFNVIDNDTNDTNFLTISDLAIYGGSGGGNANNLIVTGSGTNKYIQNCSLYYSDQMSASFAGSITTFVNNNTYSPDYAYSLYSGDKVLVQGNYFYEGGVYSASGSYWTISNNTFQDCITAVNYRGSHHTITDNLIIGSTGHALLGTTNSPTYVLIDSNIVYDTADGFNDIDAETTDYSVITNNVLHGDGTSDRGIYLDEADYNVVSGNSITGHDVAGIQEDADCQNNLIYGNNVQDGYALSGTAPEKFVTMGDGGFGTTTPAGKLHTVVSSTKPALIGGDTIASFTACTLPTAAKTTISKASIETGVAAGDLVIITGGTTGGTALLGLYRVTIAAANLLTVDRDTHASGTDITDATLTIVKDVVAVTATDGTYGQRIMNYSHQDKPLQIGGDVLAATGHSLGSEDVLIGGKLEVDRVAYFDNITYMQGSQNQITAAFFMDDVSGAGNVSGPAFNGTGRTAAIRADVTRTQFLLHSTAGTGSQFVFTKLAVNVATDDYDHTDQTNPTIFVQSALDPDTSNNQWGSFAHDQEDFIITTGANTGAGSAPTTDENAIVFSPRGTEKFRVTQGVAMAPSTTTASPTVYANDASIAVAFSVVRVAGDGAAVVLDADPAVADGTADGQILYIQGCSDSNTVQIADACNTQLAGGAAITLGLGDIITLLWDDGGSLWRETSRSNN